MKLDAAQLQTMPLSEPVRELLLSLVLQWAELDGAISILCGTWFGLNPTSSSILLGRASASEKLRKIEKLCAAHSLPEVAKSYKQLRRDYERWSKPRNLIAHSKLIGADANDHEVLLFATYEVVQHKELAIDRIGMPAVKNALEWGRELAAHCLKLADQRGHFDEPK